MSGEAPQTVATKPALAPDGSMIQRSTGAVALCWTLAIGISLAWNLQLTEKQALDMAYAMARSSLNQDIALFRWANHHGGVYVPITEHQPPEPWLSHLPGHLAKSTDGRNLTLLCPSAVLRQSRHERGSNDGMVSRITNLQVINPANAPDAWEKSQLEAFARGNKKEAWTGGEMDSPNYLRFLRPVNAEPGCDKCHTSPSQKTGEVQGAIGITLPLAPYFAQIKAAHGNLFLVHGFFWILGLAGIGLSSRALRQREQYIQNLNQTLASRIEERTAALTEQVQRNTAILSASMDGLLIVDMQGWVQDCNDAYCRMLGYSREEILRMNVTDIDATLHAPEVAAAIDKMRENSRWQFDSQNRRKDGSLMSVEINLVLPEIGGRHWFFVFIHDITGRKRSEAELIRARDAAQNANLAKSDFLSRMSHELRTPLTAIIGFGQLLKTQPPSLTAQQADNVNEVLHAGQHLLTQINEILDLSQIESGRVELSIEPVAMQPLLKESVAQLRPLAAQRSIAIELDMQDGATILADRTRLMQVVLNLLSNAIKYNREHGHIQVSTRATGEKPTEKKLRIEVQDTGRGIAQTQLSQLFKPFERLESAYDGIEGTGIGLALVKRLVEAMGGEIGVKSALGIGSCFWFELPAATRPADQASAKKVGDGRTAANPPRSGIAAPDQAKRSSLLYIEDNPTNLKLVQKILTTCRPDITLLRAENAKTGLDIAHQEHPQLILLDINLPDMNGFDMLSQLQNDPALKAIPVIATMTDATPRDIKRCVAAGFANCLAKPLDFAGFRATLNRYLPDSQETRA